MLTASLLLDESGVFQPLEGLSWWSTVNLSRSHPEHAWLLSLSAPKNVFSRSLRLQGLFSGQGLVLEPLLSTHRAAW